ncbi:MAG: hypothetical protein E7676_01350 [Ruminococcaceae bacterium]|nr:hypothetical protein [Oscillospiraceae bacterium]
MQTKLFKIALFALILAMILSPLCSCGKKNDDNSDAIKLSFKASASYDYLKSIDGSKVTISGYMATSSPVDGSFMFLMNLPYQNCPFCVPNTSELSNTMEIYPKKDESFGYTSQAIKVVGTLEVADNPDEPFTDMYGYEFSFKIVDATYTVIKAEELSADLALWQKIAEADVVNDIYKMYDYVNFLCSWNTYYVNSYTDADGTVIPGYYVWPSAAKNYIYTDGAQFNYGYKDGYFDSIVKKIESIDKTAFADLVSNVRKAEELSKKALAELEAGNYTSEFKYIEMFGREDYVYTLDKGAELKSEMNQIYIEFSIWLGSYEM